MKEWMAKALELLKATLRSPKHELNELDWKQSLSPDKKRLTEHLSAFSNHPGGGFLVFGIDVWGNPSSIVASATAEIIGKLASLGRDALEPPIVIDHSCEEFEAARLLFIHIPESAVKPVHLRGRGIECAFIRSGGTTREASRQEVGTMMLNSRTPTWEELHASVHLSDGDLRSKLSIEPIFQMLKRPIATAHAETMAWLEGEQFISRDPTGGGHVTNLGAIAAAHPLSEFPSVSRKSVRVVVYDGLNKAKAKQEQEGKSGYAIGFPGLIRFVTGLLPSSEIIKAALRTTRTVYPAP